VLARRADPHDRKRWRFPLTAAGGAACERGEIPAALEAARVHSEGSLPPGAFETAVSSLREALAQGIGTTFVVITAISALALAVTLLLPQRELADDR
jgi:hypothetical protein